MGRGSLQSAAAVLAMAMAIGVAGAAEAQQYNWNGFYIGAEAGGGSGNSEWTFLGNNGNPDPLGNPNPTHVFFANPSPGGPSGPAFSSGLLGGHVGFMHQTDGLVLGVDGAWDWTRLSGTTIQDPRANPPDKFDVSINSIGTINGQLGVANDRWLAYALGGIAFGKLDISHSGQCNTGCTTFLNSGGSSPVGWDAGAGISYAFTNSIIIGAEYDHVDLGTSDVTLNDVIHPGSPFFEVRRTHPAIDEIKARVSWKLTN